MQCSEPFTVAPDGLLDLGSYRREEEIPHTSCKSTGSEKKKLVSPFAFCGDKPKPKKRKDKLSEIKWWERETREKKFYFLSHSFFPSTGRKNWIQSEPGIACRDQSIMVTHPLPLYERDAVVYFPSLALLVGAFRSMSVCTICLRVFLPSLYPLPEH